MRQEAYVPDFPRPPEEDIQSAISIENSVPPEEQELYDGCVGNKHMKDRHTNMELRNGCILVHHVYLLCSLKHPMSKNPNLLEEKRIRLEKERKKKKARKTKRSK